MITQLIMFKKLYPKGYNLNKKRQNYTRKDII